jgi:transcriptional regulator with XRE-family HTH domain
MNLAIALGNTIRKMRVDREITLRQLSARSHTSLGYLSEIERGTKEVSSTVLQSIADGLDVPLYLILSECSVSLMCADEREKENRGMENLVAF